MLPGAVLLPADAMAALLLQLAKVSLVLLMSPLVKSPDLLELLFCLLSNGCVTC